LIAWLHARLLHARGRKALLDRKILSVLSYSA
jgi:hypothetical protein